MLRRTNGLVWPCALAVSGLVGCSATDDGALHFEDHGLVYCGNTALEQFGVGIDLEHRSGQPITIESVRSTGSDGMRLVGAVVVDRPGGVVATSEWPLAGRWPGKREAIGAVVPPDTGVGLVVGVGRVEPDGGSLGTLVISYSEGGHEHEVDTHVTVRMAPTC